MTTAEGGGAAAGSERGLVRAGRWFLRRGWIHLLLLTLTGIFLYPLLWMASSSIKTDEELADPSLLPQAPHTCARSPYARQVVALERPEGASEAQWPALEAMLLEQAGAAVREQLPSPSPAYATAWCRSAAIVLGRQAIAHILHGDWASAALAGPAIQRACTPEAARQALDESLARLELLGLRLTTDDAQQFELLDLAHLASAVQVVSGDAELQPGAEALRIGYGFDHGDEPLVLAIGFDWPAGIDAAQFHRLEVQMRFDDSWNSMAAEIDSGGRQWRAGRRVPLAQNRVTTTAYQPPSYDDGTYRDHSWVPLLAGQGLALPPGHAVLRLTIRHSSLARVLWERVERNYLRVFQSVPFWTYVGNSVLLVGLVVVGSLFSSAFVAYAFARLQWPGRSVAFMLLLATMMLPSQVTMVPSFLVWRSLGWYNTLNPLWIGSWLGNAFFIYLMVQQLRTIPRELEEAARIDGLNALQTWWYVILPQLAPSLAAIAVMSFLGSWNDFMGPLIYLSDQSRFPLSLGLFGMKIQSTATDFGMIMAGNLLMTLPTIVVFFCFQRYFIQGMASSGIKG